MGLIITWLFFPPLQAQEVHPGSDSTLVFRFQPCIQMFKEGYKENRQTLGRLKVRLKTFAKGKDTLYVNGYSGECGNEPRNLRTAYHRCNNLKGYLIDHFGLRERDFKTVNFPYADAVPGDVVTLGFYPLQAIVPAEAVTVPAKQDAVVAVPEEEPEAVVVPPAEAETVAAVSEPSEPETQPSAAETIPHRNHLAACRWYAGAELGIPMGASTFTSFSSAGKAGFGGGVLGGYRISPLLSAEVGISFGFMRLGASKCCSDYWLGADGARYLEHVAGMDSYSFRDIHSSVSVQQYALRLNADMLQIIRPDWNKRWSLTLSPAIYGIGTQATLKENGTDATIIKRDGRFQFGTGAAIGGSYQVTGNLGIGLRSGVTWVFGERFDGIVPTDHKENMIWNNTVTFIWRFGCNQ